MSDYQIPFFDWDDQYDPKIRAWINFFWDCHNTKDRISQILSINSTVFSRFSIFEKDILAVFDNDYLSMDMNVLQKCPKEEYKQWLTDHDCLSEKNIHHIIFQNKVLWGDKAHSDNRIALPRGFHSSFHKLLNNANTLPHEQILKFIKVESSYLTTKVLKRLEEIDKHYSHEFFNQPYNLYKEECFAQDYKRKYFW